MRSREKTIARLRQSQQGPAPVRLENVVALADEAGKPVWIQLAKPGEFRGHPAGPFALNTQVFAEIVANFNSTENQRVPIDYEHASESDPTDGNISVSGAPANGWITQLQVRPDGNLWGCVEWLPQAREQIKSGAYRYISPAIRFGARDRVSGKSIGAKLSSAGLTNTPFLDGMQPLAAKDVEGEPLDALRNALQMPDYAEAAQLSAALDRVEAMSAEECRPFVARLRDEIRLPLTTPDDEVFAAARSLTSSTETIGHEPSNADVVGEVVTTMSDAKIAELSAQNTELTLRLKASEAECITLKAAVDGLKRAQDERDAQELEQLVDDAILTYKDSKGITNADRPHLLSFAKASKEGFRGLYPAVAADKKHLLRTMTQGRAGDGLPAVGGVDGNRDNVINLADVTEELPTVGELVAEIQLKDPSVSWEKAHVMAHEKLTKKLNKAIAKKRAG